MDTKIIDFLEGRINAENFIHELNSDDAVQESVRSLLPEAAKTNPNHPFWSKISFSALERCGFDYLRYLQRMCRFDGTISDNLNLFASLERTAGMATGNIDFTTRYHDIFDLYLQVTKDCFDGPEVASVVEEIITEALKKPTKKERVSAAKRMIKERFHVKEKEWPRWIQGAEWPMGRRSPMKFERTEKMNEGRIYYFIDADTGEQRKIIQWH